MAKHVPKTRVVIGGVDVSHCVLAVTSTRRPGDLEVVNLTLAVDRLELNHDHAETQVLTYHIAEELVD